jgi:peptide deformylase
MVMEVVVPDTYKHLFVQDDKRPIVKVPAEVLRRKAAEVPRVLHRHKVLAENMSRIMREAHGVGLAAPQIGVLERIIVIAPDRKPVVMFNPRITHLEGKQVGEEGCLSIPGLYGDVERALLVEVTALDKKGRETVFELEGLAARVVQHEIDHLDGVLFIDKVDPATLHWRNPHDDEDL